MSFKGILLPRLWRNLIQSNRWFHISMRHPVHEEQFKSSCYIGVSDDRHFHSSSVTSSAVETAVNCEQLFDFQNNWPNDVKNTLIQDMTVYQDFITIDEEQQLHAEVEKIMKRSRYQYDHWDDAIHGYREREKGDWSTENEKILQRIRDKAFTANIIPQVHVLDLAADGIIKPHVDSSRYCGSTIAGLSLLTDCIMRLRRVDENQYKQGAIGEDTVKSTSVPTKTEEKDSNLEYNYFVDILLRQRSLYIMKDSARYHFSHEVLPTKSTFLNNEIIKNRRISIICRNQV